MKGKDELSNLLKGKRIIYISTKNKDYIRTTQEIEMLEELGKKCIIISYNDRSYIIRFFKCFLKALFINIKSYEIVYVGFMAQMIIPLLAWRWRGKIIITDFFISIFDTLTNDRKKIRNNSFVGKYVKKIDKTTIAKSNYIVADTKAHADYFINGLGVKEEHCFVLYLCANPKIYYPRTIEKPEYYKGKFLVLYFGSILPLQGVEYILKAISILQENKDIHFIMVGPIEKKLMKPESKNVTYIQWLSQKELAEYIGFSDLCLAGHFSESIEKAQRTIPGKAYIYEAMDKKMILGDTPANHELFEEDQKHYFTKSGNGKALSECILKVYNESERLVYL